MWVGGCGAVLVRNFHSGAAFGAEGALKLAPTRVARAQKWRRLELIFEEKTPGKYRAEYGPDDVSLFAPYDVFKVGIGAEAWLVRDAFPAGPREQPRWRGLTTADGRWPRCVEGALGSYLRLWCVPAVARADHRHAAVLGMPDGR
jgi:hypothetical protein